MTVVRTSFFKPNLRNHFHNPPNNATDIFTLCKLRRLEEAIKALFSAPAQHLPSSTYSSILQLCIDLKADKEGKSLHNHLSAIGFVQDVHFSTKLVIFYSKIGDCTSARQVFDEMPERSIVTWTAMISCYTQNGYSQEAVKIFNMAHGLGFRSNQYTYGSALTACRSVGCLRTGEQIHSCVVKSRFGSNLFVQSALMDMYLTCGSVTNALFLFDRMPIKDIVSWNTIIRGVSDHGLYGSTSKLFRLMIRDGIMPDHITLASILKSCAALKIPANVDVIHSLVVKLGFQFDPVAIGSLVDSYAKCGRILEAKEVFLSLSQPDLIACTAMITALASGKEGHKEALGIFRSINQAHLKLDGVILCSMLNICAHSDWIGMGRQIHASVIKSNLLNDMALQNALIDMYGKSGDLKDACRAFDEMPIRNVVSWTSQMFNFGKFGCDESALALFADMEKDGIKPNDITFLAIMNACAYAGRTKEGMVLFNSMVKRYKLTPRAEHYCSAVDLLVRGGTFEFIQKMNFKRNTSIWGALVRACRTHGNLATGRLQQEIF